jgi:hypothetical protein
VYVLYKLGLCTCCLRHLIGAFWQEFYSFEFFFSCEGFVRGDSGDSVEWIICVQEVLTFFQVQSSLTPISFGAVSFTVGSKLCL